MGLASKTARQQANLAESHPLHHHALVPADSRRGPCTGLDVANLRANVEFGGGYHEDHPVIQMLWQVLSTFTSDEKAAFLRFITACSRYVSDLTMTQTGRLQHLTGGSTRASIHQRASLESTCQLS